MSCDCTEKVSLLIDGELPPAEARAVERHLLECAECQQVRVDFLNLRSQLSAYKPMFSPEVQRQALAKILSRQGATASGSRRRSPVRERRPMFGLNWGFNPARVAIAGLIIVGALIALAVYRNPLHRDAGPSHELAANKSTPAPTVDKSTMQNKTDSPVTAENRQPKPTIAVPRLIAKPANRSRNATVASTQRTPVAPVELNDKSDLKNAAVSPVRSGDAETMTALHFEKSELLLRAFRNVRLAENGGAEILYEKQRAQQLVYQNIMLRREADAAGDVQAATLLESLEPILLDIANLPQHPENDDVRAIQARVERKNIVALLQVNSTSLARALD